MTTLANTYTTIMERIHAAERAANRDQGSVTLIGVSKLQSSDKIRAAAEAGLDHVGENYLQEAIEKIKSLNDTSLEWHFIGDIQSNKTALIAEHFNWVHSVNRLKIARRLNEQRNKDKAPLKVFIQVNIDKEASKSGICAYNDAVELARFCNEAAGLELMGLMSIPRINKRFAQQLAGFEAVANLAERITKEVSMPKCLSMGMSGDLEAAIMAGATHVRVGTALFGERSN